MQFLTSESFAVMDERSERDATVGVWTRRAVDPDGDHYSRYRTAFLLAGEVVGGIGVNGLRSMLDEHGGPEHRDGDVWKTIDEGKMLMKSEEELEEDLGTEARKKDEGQE